MKRHAAAILCSLLIHGALLSLSPLVGGERKKSGPPPPISFFIHLEEASGIIEQAVSPITAGSARSSVPKPALPSESESSARQDPELLAEETGRESTEAVDSPAAGLAWEAPISPAADRPGAADGASSQAPGPVPSSPEGRGPRLHPRPLSRSNPPPAYPAEARRFGQQGMVLLEVLVDASGRVESLQIVGPSGVKSLDQAALKAVREWRFLSGQEDGRPTAMSVRVPVRFKLD